MTSLDISPAASRARDRVTFGAAMLDAVWPDKEWYTKPDLETLEMGSAHNCVGSQLAGQLFWDFVGQFISLVGTGKPSEMSNHDFVDACGFFVKTCADTERGYELLNQEWREVILAKRRNIFNRARRDRLSKIINNMTSVHETLQNGSTDVEAARQTIAELRQAGYNLATVIGLMETDVALYKA